MKLLTAAILLALLATGLQAEPRHCWTDKKWIAGEIAIGASWLASGIAVNHTRAGGTNLFGNHTTSADVAGFETLVFAGYTGLHALEWKFGHDDPKKGWRIFSYVAIPAVSVAWGTATAVDALNSTPAVSHAVPALRCGKLVCR